MINFKRLLLFFSLALLIGACSSSKSLLSELNIAKGDTFNYQVEQGTDMSFSIMGQDMSTTGNQVTDYTMKVADKAPDGNTVMDITIDRVSVQSSIPMMGDIKYDSSKKEGNNEQLQGLGAMVGKTFQSIYNPKGEITKVVGTQQIMDDLAKALGGSGTEQLLSQFGLAPEAMAQSLGNNIVFVAPNAIKQGASWTKKTEVGTGMKTILETTYTLVESKNGQSKLNVTGTAKTNPDASEVEVQGMKLAYNFQGPITGTVLVEEKTGMAISSSIKQDLKGKMQMKGTPMGDIDLDATFLVTINSKRK